MAIMARAKSGRVLPILTVVVVLYLHICAALDNGE